MAFTIRYQRLFELRILPGHDLDAADGTAFADRPANEQVAALEGLDLSQYLRIRPDAQTRQVMAGLKIKAHLGRNMFFAGISVSEEDNGGNPAYRPYVPPQPGTRLRFVLESVNPLLPNLLGLPWRPPFQAGLWLSNASGLNYPSLSQEPPDYNAGNDYEMGDLVLQGGNLYEALEDVPNASVTPGTDPSIWAQINDHDYANRNDLQLVANRLSYRLPSGASETNVDWELRDPGLNVVASGNRTEASPFYSLLMDFGDIPHGAYTLVLTGTNGFSAMHVLQVYPELYRPGVLGVVEIVHDTGLGDFRLLEANGILKTVANETETPVFDLRLRRRSAFFRYIFTPDLAPATPLGDLQAEVDNRYVTQAPVPLLKERVAVTYDGGTVLPNPGPNLLKNESNRVFAEIFVYT